MNLQVTEPVYVSKQRTKDFRKRYKEFIALSLQIYTRLYTANTQVNSGIRNFV